MNILISHFLLGLSLAAPIGPINAAQIDRGIRGGFLHAWLVGLGAMLADGVFMILVFLGVIHFLNIPFMRTFLLLSGFFILTYIGAESLIKARQNSIETRSNNEPLFKSFSAGFIMSISNPLSILFWVGIYGSVLADMIAKYDGYEVFVYSIAIMTGILLWDVVMAIVASLFRHILTPTLLTFISVVSGLSLIGYGFYFGIEAYYFLINS